MSIIIRMVFKGLFTEVSQILEVKCLYRLQLGFQVSVCLKNAL